jgi:PhnB protein
MTLMPQLWVRRGPAAVEFYKAAFGAVEEYRFGDEEIVAQLSVAGSSFWVHDETPELRHFSPESVAGPTARMLLVVDDPDALVDQATAAGATVVSPVQEEHGWRVGRIQDPFGHPWEIGTPLGDWPPAG